ncbi:hypothetical protein PHET_09924 [Paragonimus heterotremus]|uniref:Uncharacterized protein n=1 Tax=Paragonimus heterotremus TaxID=100268 RepID=A0A8J4T234_9TREM|nr:hypothetical protein PHET_09924 [Paragonimus heterotremus]
MQLINMGLERLTDVLALVHLKRLDALHVIPGPGNPIVEQAGQFWRPFVIWALRNVLDLNELDKRPITCEDMMEATTLFKSFGQAVLLRTQKSHCNTEVIAPPNPGSEFGLNILPPRRSPALHRLIANRSQESSSVSRYSMIRNSWLDTLVRNSDTPQLITTQVNNGVHEFDLNGDSNEFNATCLNADTIKEWISITSCPPMSETRRQTVHRFVEKIITSVADRLVRQTRIMDMCPSILRRLVERELSSPDP